MFLKLAAVYSFILAYCSRTFSPKEIVFPDEKKNDDDTKDGGKIVKGKTVYLNINLSYECWPDLRKFKFLSIVDGYISDHYPFAAIWLLIFYWNVFNFPWFFLIQWYFFNEDFKNNFF